jgi:predicted SAM-dependent methyltransferase
LMLDWDITFTPDDVYKVLDEAGDDPMKVVTGCYVTWFGVDGALRPCWFEEVDGEEYVPAPSFRSGEIIPLTVAGMGFTLMHRDLLLKMEKAANDDPWPWFGHDVIGNDRVGEDLTFCKRARQVGATIWGHGGVQLGHTKMKTLYPIDIGNAAFVQSGTTKQFLNVGGASKSIPVPERYLGWKHVLLDIYPGPDVDIVLDATNLTELNPDQFDAVLCSHAIEHLEIHDIPTVLGGMAHVLKPDGMVEIICPNFEWVFDQISAGAQLDDIAYESPSGPIRYRDMLFGYEKEIESGKPYYAHKTAIARQFLEQLLQQAGFEDIETLTEDGCDLHMTARKPLAS